MSLYRGAIATNKKRTKLISSFTFLSLKSEFSSFLNNLRILLPYLASIIGGTSFLENVLLQESKTPVQPPTKIFSLFKLKQSTILNFWRTCWQTAIPSNYIPKPVLYHLLCDYSDVNKVIKINLHCQRCNYNEPRQWSYLNCNSHM